MQLVAYGAQDIYLTGNPQITFFKVVYRRHTNFAMESVEQTLNGSVGFGNKVTSTISRNGDLVHKMYLELSASTTSHDDTGPNPGSALINEVEVEIGGQRIDKHYGHWMEVWAELSQVNPTGHSTMYPCGHPCGQYYVCSVSTLGVPVAPLTSRGPCAPPLIPCTAQYPCGQNLTIGMNP